MLKIKENKTQKGITLIALVITIIVLLILAGVSISAIAGNENAMEKAKQAKTANEQGAEEDSIKLAVINAVAKGTNGMVGAQDLKDELEGLVSSSSLDGITDNNGPWTVD